MTCYTLLTYYYTSEKNMNEIVLYTPLEESYPEILRFWNYVKNDDQHPHQMSTINSIPYFWKCEKGHEFKSSILHVTFFFSIFRSVPCPACHAKRGSKGYKKPQRVNDKLCSPKNSVIFSDAQPEIAKTWDQHRNGSIYSPHQFAQFSTKRFWWVCENGHNFDCTIANRNKYGCPVCRNWRVQVGFNDLGTQFPQVARMWHPTLNGDTTPYDIVLGSDNVYWWKCLTYPEHEWRAKPWYMTSNKNPGCPYCSGKRVSNHNSLAANRPDVLRMWDYSKNTKKPSTYTVFSNQKVWWKCEEGHSWNTKIISVTRVNSGCPVCWRKKKMSRGEREVISYVRTLVDDSDPDQFRDGVRDVIPPLELDIYLPNKNIAIEYNGVHWHSEKVKKGKNVYANYEKWKQCRDIGIQLITVWEDEWLYRKDIVKKMLAHKIGVSVEPTVYARNTTVGVVGKKVADKFLNDNHIQGSPRGSVHFGLFIGDNLVAVSSWRKNGEKLYLDRYATDRKVVGGMGKLLKKGMQYAVDNGCSVIVTFSDHSVSDGSLYEKLGFRNDGEIRPDYQYVVRDQRVHKFNYRLKRFRNDPNLVYKDGLTERELADMNGLNRIYDCGKTRWVYDVV